MEHETKYKAQLAVCIAACVMLILGMVGLTAIFAGCKSTRGVDQRILEGQRAAIENEARYKVLERAVDNCIRELEDLARRSGDVEDDIDAAIRYFDEYQRIVERCLRDYLEAREEKQKAADN